MVRGNEYLEFETDQSTGNDRPRRRRRQPPRLGNADQNDDPIPGLILLASIVLFPILLALGVSSEGNPAPNVARPEVRQSRVSAIQAHPEMGFAPRVSPPARSQENGLVDVALLLIKETRTEAIPFAPREYGCADRPGVMQTLSIDGSEPRLYELLLCEQPTLSKQALRMNALTRPPRLLEKFDPVYSQAARDALHQGTVFLQILINERGRVANVKIIRPLGLGLDEEAIRAVSRWRFRPALKDGVPVPVWADVEVNFKLL